MTCTGVVRSVVLPLPSCPRPASPQTKTRPSASRATEWSAPAATATAVETPETRTGVEREVFVPSPSCPDELRPQVMTVPSDLSATAWLRPPAKATTPDSPETLTGRVCRAVRLPLPSSPLAPPPHARTVPSASNA